MLIPTFDHGETLRAAVRCAVNQTRNDIRVHVIGDGAPLETNNLMDELCSLDQTVSFHPNPKSPRTGEPYRDALLRNIDAKVRSVSVRR